MLTVSIGGITQSPLPAMHWEPQRQTEHMPALCVPVTCRDLKEKGQGPSLSTLSRFWALSTPTTTTPEQPQQRAEEHHAGRENSGLQSSDQRVAALSGNAKS